MRMSAVLVNMTRYLYIPPMSTSFPEALRVGRASGGAGTHLSNRLRVARAERGLSQEQLARAAGVSRQTISSIEKGQYGPSALLAFRLARVLGTPVDELFWIDDGTMSDKEKIDGSPRSAR